MPTEPSSLNRGCRPAAERSMMASRRLARATGPSIRNPSASGPRWAIRPAMTRADSASGPPSAGSGRNVPAMPHMVSRRYRRRRPAGPDLTSSPCPARGQGTATGVMGNGMVQLSGQRFLVTGGGGFIGRYVVQRLLEAGARVRILDLPGRGERFAGAGGVELVGGDLRRPDEVRAAVEGVA